MSAILSRFFTFLFYQFQTVDMVSPSVIDISKNKNIKLSPFYILGDVVEDVRTVFERLGDETVYIPTLV